MLTALCWLCCAASTGFAQNRCLIRVDLINHNRYAYHTAEECEGFFHTAPWGNWGVNSNVGTRADTDQFKGWRQNCAQTKVEWNSCASRANFRGPNQLNFPNRLFYYPYPLNWYPLTDSFSWNDYIAPFGESYNVDQYSPCGWNTYGSFQLSAIVSARTDTNGDGIADKGGCADLDGRVVSLTGNFMSVYELDSPDADDLIQTLLFANLQVTLRCTPDACFQPLDRNRDGWHDDTTDFWSADYQWPTLYENPQGLKSRADERNVPAKRIDATIRIGYVRGIYNGI
jgi:hypothetical protein